MENERKKATIHKALIPTLILLSVSLFSGCNGPPLAPQRGVTSPEGRTGTIQSGGARLSYFIEGQGIPCLVVSDGDLISKTMSSELKQYFQFIFIRSRMNMIEVGDINSISFDLLADDVEEIRKSLNIETVAVFGHSITGLIALHYGRRYPEHTCFVIMNGTPPSANEQSRNITKAFWEEHASKERKLALTNKWIGISRDALSKQIGTDSMKRLYVLDGPQIWYDFNFDATRLLRDTFWNTRLWNHIFNNLMAKYDLSQGRAIKVPVFLSLGKEDYYVPFTLWDTEKEKIPNLSLHLFEKSGHYPYFEQKELFRNTLMTWIQSLNLQE